MKKQIAWFGIFALTASPSLFAGSIQIQCANGQFSIFSSANNEESCVVGKTFVVNGVEEEQEVVDIAAGDNFFDDFPLDAGDQASLALQLTCRADVKGISLSSSLASTTTGCSSLDSDESTEEEVTEEVEAIDDDLEDGIADVDTIGESEDAADVDIPEVCQAASFDQDACLQTISSLLASISPNNGEDSE